MHKKVLPLLKVLGIVPKKVPFPKKSAQKSAKKSDPKKFKTKVQKWGLEKCTQIFLPLVRVLKLVP